ncbi:hypothetical protein [Gloeothece verrucosa]|nr:hypothetical protein [Gloeothece verrucosa]
MAGFILLLIIGLLYLLINLPQEVKQQKVKNKKFLDSKSHRNKSSIKSLNTAPKKDAVISVLESKVLKLVGGQRDVAQRLIDNIKRKNVDKDEIWCWEKVIEDLERDRR